MLRNHKIGLMFIWMGIEKKKFSFWSKQINRHTKKQKSGFIETQFFDFSSLFLFLMSLILEKCKKKLFILIVCLFFSTKKKIANLWFLINKIRLSVSRVKECQKKILLVRWWCKPEWFNIKRWDKTFRRKVFPRSYFWLRNLALHLFHSSFRALKEIKSHFTIFPSLWYGIYFSYNSTCFAWHSSVDGGKFYAGCRMINVCDQTSHKRFFMLCTMYLHISLCFRWSKRILFGCLVEWEIRRLQVIVRARGW